MGNRTAPDGTPLHLFYGGPFSNWVRSPFSMEVDGRPVDFWCGEQAFVYLKARLFRDEAAMNSVMEEDDPFEIKACGRAVAGFDQGDWERHRLPVMSQVVRHKVLQHAPTRAALLATRGRTIAEASPSDVVWGIGYGEDHPWAAQPRRWRGLNLLGRIYTGLRVEIVGG